MSELSKKTKRFSRQASMQLLAWIVCAFLLAPSILAQRARFDDFFASPNTGAPANQVPSLSQPILGAPPAVLQPPQFLPPGAVPGQVIGPGGSVNQGTAGLPQITQPSFDPYSAPNLTFPVFPRANQPGVQNPNQNFGIPQPNVGSTVGGPVFQPQQFPQSQFGSQFGSQFNQANPTRWPYEGTGTNWLPSVNWAWPQQAWQSFRTDFLPRFLERPRARQTFLHGSNGNELNINDIELATTATLPNFLQSGEPLRISPGFIFHFWNGPDSNVYPAFDLPAQAYSTYLSFDHTTNPRNPFGLENNLTVGFYSDFDNTSSDALRLTGRLLTWRRINPYIVGKLGVEYFDRVNVKLLPAVGLYLTPNPDMKLDLYFPRTKLAHRIPNVADFEAWAYVGGEYGGGSWAIDRRDGTPDQVDINDVRAYLGVEWMGPRRVTGFFEFGYVFNRDLVYRSNALNSLDLQDTLMIRSGIAF